MVVLGGLDLCKWFTNHRQLQDKIFETENTESDHTFDVNTTKNTWSVNWDLHTDGFVFTFDEILPLSSTVILLKSDPRPPKSISLFVSLKAF